MSKYKCDSLFMLTKMKFADNTSLKQKKALLSECRNFIKWCDKNYPILIGMIRRASDQIPLELDQKIKIDDFINVKEYFVGRKDKRKKRYSSKSEINKISKMPYISNMMQMFSLKIMSNPKYNKPSEWMNAKYRGSKVRIDGLNFDSILSAVNGMEPVKVDLSLYSMCTLRAKTEYKIAKEMVDIPSKNKEAVAKDCKKICGLIENDAKIFPVILKQCSEGLEKLARAQRLEQESEKAKKEIKDLRERGTVVKDAINQLNTSKSERE